jgi:hypothetical protein
VFVRDGNGTWSQQAYLKASNTGEGDEFGSSVSISGDTAVVGAPYEDSDADGSGGDQSDNTAGDAGAVYVFVRQNTIWSQEAYLKASNSDPGDYFGYSVSASGETIAVGAIAEASAATGINGDDEDNSRFLAGAVYLFTRAAGNWSQHTYLKASNAGSSDEFGFSVCLSGNDLIVGAPYERSLASGVGGDESDNSGSEPGAAYIYARDGNGNWSQQAYLKATVNDGGDDRFGWTVGISGNHAVVSTPFEDTRGGDAGAVYVFSKSGGVWTTNETLFGGETETGDQFGRCVAIDGTLIVAGASGEDGGGAGIDADETSNTASASGAAYLFVLPAPNAPGLRISGPKTIKTSRSRHSLRGTAADADGDLLRVEVLDQRPRGGRMFRPASGAAVWSFTAPLKPGRNRIEARAMDQGGRFSPKVRITVIRK